MGLGKKIEDVKAFLSEDIWQINLDDLSKMKARLVKDGRVVLLMLKTFSAQKIGFQSVALSFFCTMAAIPFLAFAFVVTGGFGLEPCSIDAWRYI